MSSESRIAEYFVVCGLSETSKPLKEDANSTWVTADKKDPITDICIIDVTMEEQCPIGFTCIESTPSGFESNLNHGSLTSHNLMLCYKRGKIDPPIIDIGIYDEGTDSLMPDVHIIETTPEGRCANVNNATGMGSHAIYLTYRRARSSSPQNALVVTDICIILRNKDEKAPYAFLEIDKNLNKGLLGSNVHLCYKKSVRQVDSIAFHPDMLGRYPVENTGSFGIEQTVALFCLPMGTTIECWGEDTHHPLPQASSFVLTNQESDKIYGTAVTFYESYDEGKLTEEQKIHLRVLRGDGRKSTRRKSLHTNKSICLLSRWPLFDVFKEFLMYLYRMTVSPQCHHIPVERYISHFMHALPFPSPQRPIVEYQISSMIKITVTRPQITPIPLSGASFVTLLENLGAENTLNLIALALTEHKIVIHSLRVSEITCVAEALITLLFPFRWNCIYIPLCPLSMCNVLEAPCPFIAGVDSRYFDLFVPPPDIVCVNLDTNTVALSTNADDKNRPTWKMLPRKACKFVKSKLNGCYKELKEATGRNDVSMNSSFRDPDIVRVERHRRIDRDIQEVMLKLMCSLMRGYRKYLLPITTRPEVGTTDPGSLFNIHEFVRSRERNSQKFYQQLVSCQHFSHFIETRCLETSDATTRTLVFFDNCLDRITSDNQLESVRLIESDVATSDHTIIIIPPEEKPSDKGGYTYTTFPQIQQHLFPLDDNPDKGQQQGCHSNKKKEDLSVHSRRTAHEVRTQQKLSRMHLNNPAKWSKLLQAHAYGCWFACLDSQTDGCSNLQAVLRAAFEVLRVMHEQDCMCFNDETYYRVMFHLSHKHDRPSLAKRVFMLSQLHNEQITAITYGLYNKAVLEGTWLDNHQSGYSLWKKVQNVWRATVMFRILYTDLKIRYPDSSSSENSDYDVSTSYDVTEEVRKDEEDGNVEAKPQKEDCGSTGGQSDHGYNSMPKQLVRRSQSENNERKTEGAVESTKPNIKPPKTLDLAINKIENISANGKATHAKINKNSAVLEDVLSDGSTIKQSPTQVDLSTSFGADSKFLSSMSDSDQLRCQELSNRRSSATPSGDKKGEFKLKGGISPLIAQKDFIEASHNSTPPPGGQNDLNGRKSRSNSGTIFSPPQLLSNKLPAVAASNSIKNSPQVEKNPLMDNPLMNNDPVEKLKISEMSIQSTPLKPLDKSVKRKDISHLMSDPLSPFTTVGAAEKKTEKSSMKRATSNSLKRNLVDEIENQMKKEEALLSNKQQNQSAVKELSRSMTYSGNDTSWTSSKLNGLIRSTTMSLGNKVKNVATNIAKDLNESMKESIAYYANEVKGSLKDVHKSSQDVSSSRTSLRSSDSSKSSSLDNKKNHLRDRVGRTSRPTSMPPNSIDSQSIQSDSASLKNAENNLEVPTQVKPVPLKSKTFVQLKCHLIVQMSSCSKCTKCKCVNYDEEIMAGWTDQDSNLNTHCYVCNAKFVPFLTIEILDKRNRKAKKRSHPLSSTSSNTEEAILKTPRRQSSNSSNNSPFRTSSTSTDELYELAFPYLSSLVLRKEVESLLQNEGIQVVATPQFVDQHPIIYWNLVWYFKRLNLPTNLFDLLQSCQQLKHYSHVKTKVAVNLMWDNLNLHEQNRDPIYVVWPQIASKSSNQNTSKYPKSLIHSIKNSIVNDDDVRSPLVALLHFNRGLNTRGSCYREILFFIIVALGKSSIDIDAFNREYKRAYDALTLTELDMYKNVDKLPSQHATMCRRTFGALNLY